MCTCVHEYGYTQNNPLLQKNPSLEIDWGKVAYLEKEQNTDRRLIKESLYIKAFDEGNLMNLKNPRPINPNCCALSSRFHFFVICTFIF